MGPSGIITVPVQHTCIIRSDAPRCTLMHRPQQSWRITIRGSMYLLLMFFFPLPSKTSVVDSDFSFSETYSDPLFTANTYRCHKDQSNIVARSSSGDTQPRPCIVKLSVVMCWTPGHKTHITNRTLPLRFNTSILLRSCDHVNKP